MHNNNNNGHDNVCGAVIMTKAIARVQPVHLMNVDWAPGCRQPLRLDQASRLGLWVRRKLAATNSINGLWVRGWFTTSCLCRKISWWIWSCCRWRPTLTLVSQFYRFFPIFLAFRDKHGRQQNTETRFDWTLAAQTGNQQDLKKLAVFAFQCFDTVGCTSGRASSLWKWWGVVICLERGADCLHMVQLMPLHPKTPIIFCLI